MILEFIGHSTLHFSKENGRRHCIEKKFALSALCTKKCISGEHNHEQKIYWVKSVAKKGQELKREANVTDHEALYLFLTAKAAALYHVAAAMAPGSGTDERMSPEM